MSNGAAYFENEMGKIYFSDAIIRHAVLPELNLEGKFQPAFDGPKCIEISKEENLVNLTVHVKVAYGVNAGSEGTKLRDNIKQALQTLTELKTGEVSVQVDQLFTPTESKPVRVDPS